MIQSMKTMLFLAEKAVVKPGQPISTYGQDEFFGLKMVQLLLPVKGHRLSAWTD